MSYYGNIHCSNCQKETRFFIEKDEHIHMIGDMTKEQNETIIGHTPCDFCNRDNVVKIAVEKGLIKGFKNSNDKIDVTDVTKQEKTADMYELFKSNFYKHPYQPEDIFEINDVKYIIKKIWAKENVEKETEKRDVADIEDQFIYQLEGPQKEMKFATVTDLEQKHLYYDIDKLPDESTNLLMDVTSDEMEEKNGVLLDFLPLGLEMEELKDITDMDFKRNVVYEGMISKNPAVVIETPSGYRGFVYDIDGICLYDIYKENFDEVLNEIDALLIIKSDR